MNPGNAFALSAPVRGMVEAIEPADFPLVLAVLMERMTLDEIQAAFKRLQPCDSRRAVKAAVLSDRKFASRVIANTP